MDDRTIDAEATALVDSLRRGESIGEAPEALVRKLYADLRQLASRQRRRWVGNETINTTALVHEAYIKLAGSDLQAESRAHLLAIASRAMRQVLVNYAELRNAKKRGGGTPDLALDDVVSEPDGALLSAEQADDIAALGEALAKLEAVDARSARIVECRFFGGMTEAETAAALGVSESTVTRGWRTARAWLYTHMERDFP
ncbi:MAG: ECF-type sigma factor, partial [Bacteroidota bacterium]